MPTHSVRAFSDNYGFEMKLPRKDNVVRNLETIIGKTVAGQGAAFDIHIYGTKYLDF